MRAATVVQLGLKDACGSLARDPIGAADRPLYSQWSVYAGATVLPESLHTAPISDRGMRPRKARRALIDAFEPPYFLPASAVAGADGRAE